MSWYYKNYLFWKYKRANHCFCFLIYSTPHQILIFENLSNCRTAPTPLVIDGHGAINLQVWAWGSGPYNEIILVEESSFKKKPVAELVGFFPVVFLWNFLSGLSLGIGPSTRVLHNMKFTSRVHTYYNKFHDFLSDDHNAS